MEQPSEDNLKKTVFDFLDAHKKAIFGTVDEEGQPHTALMLYAVDDKLNVYFGTRKAFGKHERLMKNPSVSLTVAEEKNDPMRAVDLHGIVEVVSDADAATSLEFFKGKNMSKYYVQGSDDFVMYKVKPTMVRYLDATLGDLEVQYLKFA